MEISQIKCEINAIFDMLKLHKIEEAPGVLYVAQGCINNIEIYALEVKFQPELFINKLWLVAHEAIKISNNSHVIPIDIINKAPKLGWNIHVTLHKIKEDVNNMKIIHLINENKALKAELMPYKTSVLHRIVSLIAA
ncbi:MAG: hypothetical protein EAZ53_15580 [Bacteroidetes bacterium]|nr:MAG: hypothetical protein EAZ53_15580 [Bacteroidota bacterium]